jgi:hypothetical protein
MSENPTPPPAEHPPVPPGVQPLTFEVPANLDATYSNFALISHSPSEVFLDFARVMPNMKARVAARIVVTPLNAKLLLRALEDNLLKFEAQFGEIVVPTQLADHLFRPPRPDSGD